LPVLFCFRQMSRPAVGRKDPLLCLHRIHLPTEPDCADEAKDHLSRQRNIEGLLLASFWFRDV
jgi:hypothetical protein